VKVQVRYLHLLTYVIVDTYLFKPVNTSGALLGVVVAKIKMKGYHAIASSTSGDLFAWGAVTNRNGTITVIGDGTTTYHEIPKRLAASLFDNKTVADFDVTQYNTVVLTSDGNVYSIGDGTNFLTGVGSSTFQTSYSRNTQLPTVLSSGETVIQVNLGLYTAIAIINTGRALVWGTNINGALGIGNNNPNTVVQTPVALTACSGQASFMFGSSGNTGTVFIAASNNCTTTLTPTPVVTSTSPPTITSTDSPTPIPTIAVTIIDFNDNDTFGEPVIEGSELIYTNYTNGELVVSSTFNSTRKSRRALSTKDGYTFEDQVAFVKFTVDPSTTSGNIVELWMHAGAGKFVQSTLSITPVSHAKTISVTCSASSVATMQTMSRNCSFVKGVAYTLKLNMQYASTWTLKSEIFVTSSSASICVITMPLTGFNAQSFFATPFTYVLSQSPTGTEVKRALVQDEDESMTIKVSQLGVECYKTSGCASVTKAPTAERASGASLNVAMIAGIVAGIIAGILIVILVAIIITAMYIRKRNRLQKVAVYESSILQEKQEEDEPDVEEEEDHVKDPVHAFDEPDTYNMFRSNDEL
jgi:hypothetical protein